jgi:hypothetical protein
LCAKGALGRVETKNRDFGEKRKLSENEQHFRENLLQKFLFSANFHENFSFCESFRENVPFPDTYHQKIVKKLYQNNFSPKFIIFVKIFV